VAQGLEEHQRHGAVTIDRAIGQWRRRLKWVVPQQGEQIEHLM